ncbi:MAG: hypothetical protein M1834_004471 [Cirrosporium novae-zelandiae]|nr:MAG: hypothetical protein M1834_004471 [Cirrosporium novae-zelandiae]
MVYYFKSSVISPAAEIYVGRDKEENEDLIKYGWEEDVCPSSRFHVDKLSSAHIYLRLREDQSWETIPDALLKDCAQLTKANSIEGNKKDNITVVYTPHSNLHKDSSMATGAVSFYNLALVKRTHIATRENAIINRLNKTRVTNETPDFAGEKEAHLKDKRRKERQMEEKRRKEEKREMDNRRKLKYEKDHAYDDLFSEENMEASSNQDRGTDFLDDFM